VYLPRIEDELEGVDGAVVLANFIVKMRTRRTSRRTDEPDSLPAMDPLAFFHENLVEVAVDRQIARGVGDFNLFAIVA
jgi:hypothetical protein